MRPPRPPLQPPAVALEPRATVKLQPDVDIDLGQQRNLDSATQAAERGNSAILPRESREAEGRRAVGQGLTSFDAIFLPKGTPAPIIQKLYGTIVAAMNARSGISLKEPIPRAEAGGNTDDHPRFA
jgi:hypothetical protein